MEEINWNLSHEEDILIGLILQRYENATEERLSKGQRMNLNMSIAACHLNGCPLDLDKMAGGEDRYDDFSLVHDVTGIDRYVSRETGQLTGFFLPRAALPQENEE